MSFKREIAKLAIDFMGNGMEIEGNVVRGGWLDGMHVYKAWERLVLEVLNGGYDGGLKRTIMDEISRNWESIIKSRRVFITNGKEVWVAPLRQGFLHAMRVFTEFLPTMPIGRSLTIHYGNEPDGYIGIVSVGGKRERVRINARELLMKRNLIERVLELLGILEIDPNKPEWDLFRGSLQWWCKREANKFLIKGESRCIWCNGCRTEEEES